MLAGTMDRRITIEQRTDTRNGFGEPVPAWSELATVWASYEPLQGNEAFSSQQTQAERKARFRIRYREDVDEKMRVSWAGQTWDINAINEIGRNIGLELLTTAQVP